MTEEFDRYEFKKKLEELREKSGRGTELVTVYIPPDKQISDVTSQLRDEHGQASNIKSKSTRTNVQSALDSILSRLKYIKKPPETGIAIFCGAIDVGGDKTNLDTVMVVPPEPIRSYRYHCDSTFLLEPLEEILHDKKTYGLLVLDKREATIGLLKGKTIHALKHTSSTVPGKTRRGGQSAQRFSRLREIAVHEFYTRVGEHANEVFLAVPREELLGILIGGPSPTKEEFVKGEFLHHELRQKIVDIFDVSYTDESGLYELVDAASGVLEDLELMKEKKVMDRFMKLLVNDEKMVAYGEDEVRKALEIGACETLIISEELNKIRASFVCDNCGYTLVKSYNLLPGMDTNKIGSELKCPACNSNLKLTDMIDIVVELSRIAEERGTEVVIISSDFEEGGQLRRAFGGIAAILRYKSGF
ncbi:peptide chain release factor 1 [Methanosarcinales archaeon]|uniref:Peptide chain release factor subunit 1 n=1 Tax=Candidatus Syntropharchaeum caldarium TaxID=1838285 RepID=A0A1F2P9W4_9EURY|nr:MAG: peptide chain release factor 1 [Candidatus Syntrophoarchaeum caldarius]RLG33667.1 MAG: peptide chain release factor 1 [Methanosarcinales archaeon]